MTPTELTFYSEAKMKLVRERLEAKVLSWPDAVRKEWMGRLVYFRGRRFFAFLITGALVLTKASAKDREALLRQKGAGPYAGHGRAIATWVQLPVAGPDELTPLLPYVRKGYDACR